jgi:hypothetical protein
MYACTSLETGKRLSRPQLARAAARSGCARGTVHSRILGGASNGADLSHFTPGFVPIILHLPFSTYLSLEISHYTLMLNVWLKQGMVYPLPIDACSEDSTLRPRAISRSPTPYLPRGIQRVDVMGFFRKGGPLKHPPDPTSWRNVHRAYLALLLHRCAP